MEPRKSDRGSGSGSCSGSSRVESGRPKLSLKQSSIGDKNGGLSLFNESAPLREVLTKPSRSLSSRRLRGACKVPLQTLRGGFMY